VARFWKREGEFSDIERQLRAQRPVPREEIIDQLARQLRSERGFLAHVNLRVAFASALTAVTLVVFAALGGVGQATSVTKELVGISPAASNSAAPQGGNAGGSASQSSQSQKSSQNQYDEKVTICHRPDGNPSNAQTLRLSSAGAAAHLRNHPLDTAGPCP